MKLYEKIVKDPIQVFRRQWNADGRGRLIEGLRNDDTAFSGDFGQVYVTTIKPHTIKAWHLHESAKSPQIDRMMLLRGTVRFVAAVDVGTPSPTAEKIRADVRLDFVVSDFDPYLIVIPPDMYHGFQNLGDEEAYILNVPTEAYNRESPNERRLDPYGILDFPWEISLDG